MTDKDSAGVEKGIFKVGEEFLYVLDVQNDVATQSTPPLKVVFSLPPELEFVSAHGRPRRDRRPAPARAPRRASSAST